jgi:serine/threonine protein kinase
MSPEQARGEKVDFRSDLYALGIVIFEIFTGSVPFRAETPIATIFKHLQEAPPIDDAPLPEPLMPVLHKALAKSPADRYETAAEMVRALQDARRRAFPGGRTPIAPRTPALPELLAEAERLASAGRLAEAQAVLRRAVDVDPHSAVAFRRLFEVAAALAEKSAREAL